MARRKKSETENAEGEVLAQDLAFEGDPKEVVSGWKPSLDDVIDEIGQSVGLAPSSISSARQDFVKTSISTGLLAYDLITGGGFAPGRWCGQVGAEAGGKSTTCASSIAVAQKKGIQSFFFDYEGAADPDYWSRIGVKLYGNFKSEDAQQEAQANEGFKAGPNLRYYAPASAEQGLKFILRLMQMLPDKKQYLGDWYYVMDMTQKEAKEKGIPYVPALARQTGQIWVPSSDGGQAQAIFYIDSIASMKPQALLGKKDAKAWSDESKAQALLARAMAEGLSGFKSFMVNKRVTVVATNQIREKPGVSYGNPEYAPGGNAVKHIHDGRTAMRPRSCPTGWGSGKSQDETCWDGKGKDRYTFSILKNEKSKDFSPFRSCWVRWWFESKGAPGPGIDPVYDTFQYLTMTGQMPKSGSKYEIQLPGFAQVTDWAGFKAMILDPANGGALREGCWEQLRSGEGFDMYFATPQEE